jgi:hypothetical protein
VVETFIITCMQHLKCFIKANRVISELIENNKQISLLNLDFFIFLKKSKRKTTAYYLLFFVVSILFIIFI